MGRVSESEQDKIIGRMLREYRDAKKEVAILYAEAESLGYYLVRAGEALRTDHSYADAVSIGGSRIELPTGQRLLELSNQIDAAKANKERLALRLKEAGFPPPAE
jgi:hypothetical protein